MQRQAQKAETGHARITFKFDPRKALEIILYVAGSVTEPSFHRISKILYFADREHLARYGRLMCGDSYVAMRHGPVPSGTYDILKFVRGDLQFCPAQGAEDAFRVEDSKIVRPRRDPNRAILSKSETECLDEAIKKYGKMSFTALTKESHDAAWKAADANDIIDVEQIIATLPDAEELLEYLRGSQTG